jgi:hypothetical protein
MAAKSPKRRSVRRTPKTQTKTQAPRPGAKRTIADVPATTKLAALIAVLSTPRGATLAQMTALTGWQTHSVRGALAGALKKKRGLKIVSVKTGEERVYRIAGNH